MALPSSAGRASPPALDFPSFRQQNAVLILLNLGVMLALLALHGLFRPVLGALSAAGAAALGIRFLLQLGELALMARTGLELGPAGTRTFARFVVLAHLAFAFVLSRISVGQESHHVVLLVIPVIASAFWLGLAGLALTTCAAGLMTIFQVWVPVGVLPQGSLMESFEATTVALLFVLVAVVVRLLVHRLWDREAALAESLGELGRARDRLVREERLAAVGRLSTAIAHEIRNPVAMIASSAAAAQGATAEPARVEWLAILADESRRLERLTGDFLAYAGSRPPERRRVQLRVVLGAAAGLAKAKAEEAGIRLEVLDAGDLEAWLDPFQIQQSLLNLLGNALDAVGKGGHIAVGAAGAAGRVRLWVEDDGPEVPGEIVAHLGEPFRTRKPTGTGLGLAIVDSLARAHGGWLALEENRAGRVRFVLDLPEGAEGGPP